MNTLSLRLLVIGVLLGSTQTLSAGWSIGVGLGLPSCGPCYHHPCGDYGWPYHYYRPYPVYVAPPPVYYTQPPVVLQPAPVVVQPAAVVATPTSVEAPAPRPVLTRTVATESQSSDESVHLQQLANPNERVRYDSVMQLGRIHSQRAVDPLAATLAGDQSPAVREAAARALGLIGSTRSLPALQRAALSDSDPAVRHSAEYASEVIRSR